jgi:hypothetical protein
MYGAVVDGYTAAQAVADDLAMSVDILEAAGVPYFLVPGTSSGRHVLGVEEKWRAQFLNSALRLAASSAAFLGVVARDGRVVFASHWADKRLPRVIRRSSILRMGVIRIGPSGQLLAGLESGCDIEFWRRGEEVRTASETDDPWITVPGRQLEDTFGDALVAPRGNRVAEVVPVAAQKPATVKVGLRDVATFEPFSVPGVDDIQFPIDVVYTWVDGADPDMIVKRRSFSKQGKSDIAQREVGDSRYISYDELKYSLRSIEMYLDFIRHVYIVTDGQVPGWLDANAPGVTIVDHREIFPDTALPSFNSHSIESRLHCIPGISDRYLYFNDDVFINRPVQPGQFFLGSGIARIPFSPFKIGLGDPHPHEPAPNSAGKNVRRLVENVHGRLTVHKFMHTPHPQIRSVFTELEDYDELSATTYSRFRSIDDIAPAASLHHHWAMLTGRAVPGEYRLRYIDVGRPGMRAKLDRLKNGDDVDFFCLNDVDTNPGARDEIHQTALAFLEWKYPFASRFER